MSSCRWRFTQSTCLPYVSTKSITYHVKLPAVLLQDPIPSLVWNARGNQVLSDGVYNIVHFLPKAVRVWKQKYTDRFYPVIWMDSIEHHGERICCRHQKKKKKKCADVGNTLMILALLRTQANPFPLFSRLSRLSFSFPFAVHPFSFLLQGL